MRSPAEPLVAPVWDVSKRTVYVARIAKPGRIAARLGECPKHGTAHEKGAVTGAQASKPGKFEQADTGTVFLDEIGDVPAPIQVKLLRILQEREFECLGSNVTRHIDVRVVAPTNQDLRAALAKTSTIA